tara:strand:+ start:337 stop:1011 length:675 start_codon:yes stop_codon:yes gene_type:complete
MVRKLKHKKTKKGDAALKKVRLKFQMFSAELLESELVLEDCILEFNVRFETGRKSTVVEPAESTAVAESNVSFEEQEKKKEAKKEKHKEEHKEILPKDKDLSALFKKIAFKTHPDKLRDADAEEVDYLTELYKEAASAAEVGDGMALLEIAYELDIKVSIDPKKESEWLYNKTEMLKDSIEEIKQTAEWIWYHSSGLNRELVEKMVINQLGFKVNPNSPGMSGE